MRKFYVYVHVCKATGKRYVGCTKQARPELRWGKNGGRYRYNKHFYSAILKYGWDNITHEVFEVDSEEEMYRKEIELISFYHSNDPEYGYNNSIGGEKSASGCIRSEEVRKHMSEAQKKVHSDPEYRKHRSEAQREKWSDPEYRKRISEAVKKRCSDPEVRRKRSEIQKKVHSDPEYRKKLSEATKGKSKPHSEEHKRHIAEAAKNRPKPRRIKIGLPDGTIIEITKNNLVRNYINKGKKFEYVS